MYSDIPCICIPLMNNPNKHPSESELVGMFLSFIDGTDTYINFSHQDAKVTDIRLEDIQLHPKSLVLNKKALLYHGVDFGIDLNSFMQYYVDDFIRVDEYYSKTIDYFLNTMYNSSIVAKVIPLSIWLGYFKNIVGMVMRYFKPDLISDKCIAYCEDYIHVFHEIEKNDVPVGSELKHQNYFWYTATSRPSNAWNSFNFSALNKSDGTRDAIHSGFEGGKLVQFDYDAFHIKLLAKILDYKFEGHPYNQLKDELHLSDDYSHVKTRVFQNIYGGITDEFLTHPLFQGIQAIIDELYEGYARDGYIESWFYGKRFRDIESVNPNKLFNYFLQSLETEYNVKKIREILQVLDGKKSKLVLYLYDAFIFDIHPDEESVIKTLKRLLETDDMTVKVSSGNTFGDML